ncbi:MAG TPA: metallophosphoesterase family protein [Hyphomicrobiaceae bacterium]|nr:metallophosphoesterase family protein [Hyphomicrobiaceae bacterium]
MIDFSDDAPILVFGGPYSNVRATRAMRRRALDLGIPSERTICTGDVVAYCAEPAETVREIRDWGIHVVAGNCEESLANDLGDCGCNFDEGSACNRLAKSWFEYASQRIGRADRDWMRALPTALRFSYAGLSFKVVHGGNAGISRWVFASMTDVLAEETALSASDITIAGHCGVPFVAEGHGCTWFNPGVVGMPANDGTPDAWYGLVSSTRDGVHLTTHRLTYDHAAASRSLLAAGFADPYARALVSGLWPSLDVLPDVERAATGRALTDIDLRVTKAPRSGRQTGAPSVAAE